jgi:hypothetical protein
MFFRNHFQTVRQILLSVRQILKRLIKHKNESDYEKIKKNGQPIHEIMVVMSFN